jgi:hypothetical protein
VRCGGNWKRDYGDSYTGTQGETPNTAKEPPTDYRASSQPYQVLIRTLLLRRVYAAVKKTLARAIRGCPGSRGRSDTDTIATH